MGGACRGQLHAPARPDLTLINYIAIVRCGTPRGGRARGGTRTRRTVALRCTLMCVAKQATACERKEVTYWHVG